MKEGNSAHNASAGKKTRRVSVSTKRRHAKEAWMLLLQKVLAVEAQEWKQPRITTTKHVNVHSCKAILALVLPIFKIR